MSNNSTRPIRTQEQRLIETTVGLDRDFLQKLKVVGSETAISFSGLGAIGSSIPGKPQSQTGNYLAVAGGAMAGAIAFNVKVVKIDDTGSIDITPITGAYTGYAVVTTHLGLASNLQQIIGAHDDGQLLWIQAVSTETLTIKNDASGDGSGGFNIRTPALADFVLKGPQAVLLYFDPVQNQWAFMDSSYFDNISSGGITGDLDMHNFKLLNIGAAQFTNGGLSDPTKRQIYATPTKMTFQMPALTDSFQFVFQNTTQLEIFQDTITPYNLFGNFSAVTLGDSTHIFHSLDVRVVSIYGPAGFFNAVGLCGWVTDFFPDVDGGSSIGTTSGGLSRWFDIYLMGHLYCYDAGDASKYLRIYKDNGTKFAIYDLVSGDIQVGHAFLKNGDLSPLFQANDDGIFYGRTQHHFVTSFTNGNFTIPFGTGSVNDVMFCDCTGGNIVINLPQISSLYAGKKFRFVKTDAGAFTVTINSGNFGFDKIKGANSLTLTTQWEAVTLICDALHIWGVWG